MASSLYIHIPFCLKKCSYCAFSSQVYDKQLAQDYVKAVKKELSGIGIKLDHDDKKPELDTIFFGGGTPSVFSASTLSEILTHIFHVFSVTVSAEISVEVNPGTVDRDYYNQLIGGGFNRISIGVQSFDDQLLQLVGRVHGRKEAVDAVKMAHSAGFNNISLDLMFGLPHQTVSLWQESLETAIDLAPHHFSVYQLIVEEGTSVFNSVQSGLLQLPKEDSVLLMDEVTANLCDKAGYEKYEIANFAKHGYECRHNINYWLNDEYFGVGAGAVSYIDGCREKRIATPINYIEAIERKQDPVEERERLSEEESFRETVIMGLRMVKGVSLSLLRDKYALEPLQYYGTTLEVLLEAGLVELTKTSLRISERGWPISNRLMAELV